MPPSRTLRITIDAADLPAVKAALSAGTSLVLAAKALEDLTPGKANPIVLPRAPLDELQRCADAYADAVGKLHVSPDLEAAADVEPEPSA